MSKVAEAGIVTGVVMMPILPFVTDGETAVRNIALKAREHGAQYVIPTFGVPLRDRQRAYYYAQLDRSFPGLRQRYQRHFGDQYYCSSPNVRRLKEMFKEVCAELRFETRMPVYQQERARQLPLF